MTIEMMAARRFERAWPSAAAVDADRTADIPWFLYRAGGQLHALPITKVLETMRPLPIKPVAGGPDYVRGLSIIRGMPTPVVDIGLLVNAEATKFERLITIRLGDRTIALMAETVFGKQDINRASLSRLPPLLGDAANDRIEEIATLDSELLFVLRDARIIPEDFLDCLDQDGMTP